MRFRAPVVLLCLLASCPLAMAQKTSAPAPGAGDFIVSAHAASVPSAAPLARPVVRVNGAVLTDHDLLREMYAIFPYARQHSGGFPKEMEPDIRRGALRMIEFEELVYQEATRRHLTVAPDRMAASEKQFRQHFETTQQYQYFLQTEAHGSQEIIRSKIKRSLMIEDYLKAQVVNKSSVTDSEAKAYFQNNPAPFRMPETYALQTITVLPPKPPAANSSTAAASMADAEKKMKARAEEELKQAKATKNYEGFGVLAEKISEDDYRVMMGDHRAVNVKEIPAPVLAEVSKMQVGQVSGLILVDGAYTIVRVNAHSPARTQTFAEVQGSLKTQMQQKKTEQLRRELDAQLRKSAKIEEL